jgi:hypothetical protein
LLVGFGAAMRRSELIALDVDDVTIELAGLTILVRRSKLTNSIYNAAPIVWQT